MPDIAPLELRSTSNGTYQLVLTGEHMAPAMTVFEEMGHYGQGHNWEAVARQALRMYAPEWVGLVDFEPSPTEFLAFGDDRDALEALGELLARSLRDRELLEELLRDAEDDWFDD